MKLFDFLHTRTKANELCVIREAGWIIASYWIDYEDLFSHYMAIKLENRIVESDEWGYLTIVNKNNAEIKIPCHYVDIEY